MKKPRLISSSERVGQESESGLAEKEERSERRKRRRREKGRLRAGRKGKESASEARCRAEAGVADIAKGESDPRDITTNIC